MIVGGGPAGLMAAKTILDASSDKSILIIDRNGPTYDKPCGGGVPQECIDEFPFVGKSTCHTTSEIIVSHRDIRKHFPVKMHMIKRNNMRTTMLTMLIRDTGFSCDVLFNSIVNHVDIYNKTITVNNGITIHYDWIIGADGVNSVIGKALGFKYPKAIVMVTSNQSPEEVQRNIRSEILFLDDLPGGYFWIFPKGDHVNIGMGGDVPGRKLKEMFEHHFRKLGCNEFHTVGRSAHLIPSGYRYLPRFFSSLIKSRHVILCGDAATFVNPMTEEGIYYALKSGKEAAEVILGNRTPKDYPSFHAYLKRVQKIRYEIKDLNIEKSFERIFMDDNTAHDTVKFLFSHSIPDQKTYSEEEKNHIYNTL